jgi:hypothetical protein
MACTNGDGPARSIGDEAGSPTSPSPTSAGGPLEFVLDDQYEAGEKIAVRLRNNGQRAFVYNTSYEACDMRYFDETGRRFIIPPGTHCDLIANDNVEPGDTVTLFDWKLEECVKDQWGCVEAESLEPGTYTIRGWFPPTGAGQRVAVEASFEIVES